MGNRVSISFRTGDEDSVILFSQDGGMAFVRMAQAYAVALQAKGYGPWPLGRLEPSTVMVDFIRHVTQCMSQVPSNFYLARERWLTFFGPIG